MTQATKPRVAIAVVALVLSVAAWLSSSLELTTDVASLMPSEEGQRALTLARAMTSGSIADRWVVALQARTIDDAVLASREFESLLREELFAGNDGHAPTHADLMLAGHGHQSPHAIAEITTGPSELLSEALWMAYFPRRFSFWNVVATDVDDLTSDEGLNEAAQHALAELRGPQSTLVSRVLPSDPWLVTKELMDALREGAGRRINVQRGRFVVNDPPAAVVFVERRKSNEGSHSAIKSAIERAHARMVSTSTTLRYSGIGRYAAETEAVIQSDLKRVTVVSVVCMALLLLVLFREVRVVAIAAVPVLSGIVAGLACVQLVFGEVHGLTLAFGASLVGVTIDYVVHVYCHFAVATHGTAQESTKGVWSAVLTGALTTLVGFLMLAWSLFGIMKQVALLASVGVVVSLLITRWVVPTLLVRRPVSTRARRSIEQGLQRVVSWVARRRVQTALVVSVVCVVGAWGWSHVQLATDLRALNYTSDQLRDDEAWVQNAVEIGERSKFVVAMGATKEEALQRNDQVFSLLNDAKSRGEVESFLSIGLMLPSELLQRTRDHALRSSPELGERASEAFVAAGFAPGALQEFQKALSAPPPVPLTIDALRNSLLNEFIDPFVFELPASVGTGDRVGVATFINNAADDTSLRNAVAGFDHVEWVDQGVAMRDAYVSIQSRTRELLMLGFAAVFLLLLARYKSLRWALAAVTPALLAATVTVGALAWLGITLNIVVLTALLMVVSIGVDYGVFLVDAFRSTTDEGMSASLLSVTLACLSTVIGFGLLVMSKHPVLFSVGVTTSIGVLASYVFSPVALLFGERNETAR